MDKVEGAQRLNQLWGHLAKDALVVEVQDDDIMGSVSPLGSKHLLDKWDEAWGW